MLPLLSYAVHKLLCLVIIMYCVVFSCCHKVFFVFAESASLLNIVTDILLQLAEYVMASEKPRIRTFGFLDLQKPKNLGFQNHFSTPKS